MGRLNFQEIQGVDRLAETIYPLCSVSIFQRAASQAGVLDLWPEGSKTRALPAFLRVVLEQRRDRFCILMQEIVAAAMPGYSWQPQPLSRETMDVINERIRGVGFKIPELWDADFLNSLPSHPVGQETPSVAPSRSAEPTQVPPLSQPVVNAAPFKARYLTISALPATQERGYAFEQFLQELFSAHGLKPRRPFALQGEQIDGSFDLDHQIYLVEARWRAAAINQGDLAKLDSRVAGHSSLGRGVFITAGGFSQEGVAAHQRLRPSAMIGVDGQDLFLLLEYALSLPDVLRFKVRRLVEEGVFHTPVAKFWTELKDQIA
jgi:hypothetical protein